MKETSARQHWFQIKHTTPGDRTRFIMPETLAPIKGAEDETRVLEELRPFLPAPHIELIRAAVECQAAKRAHFAATVEGDAEGRLHAFWRWQDAIANWQRIRERIADEWLLGARVALEVNPTAVRSILAKLPPGDSVVESIEEVQIALCKLAKFVGAKPAEVMP